MKPMFATRISPRTRALVLGAAAVLTLLAVRGVDGGAAGQAAAAVEVRAPSARSGGVGAVSRGSAGADRAAPGSPPPAAGRASKGTPAGPIAADRLDRPRALAEPGGDPFALAAWARSRSAPAAAPAPAMEAPPPPPPPPTAPPLPFTFFGRLVDGATQQVFLNHGARSLIVAAGETIDNQYRVERIEEQAVHFTYLPLGQPQVLAIPGTP